MRHLLIPTLLAFALLAGAAPQPERPGRSEPPPEAGEHMSAEQVRSGIERRLEWTRRRMGDLAQTERSLAEALARLDQGEPVGSVLHSIRTGPQGWREGRRQAGEHDDNERASGESRSPRAPASVEQILADVDDWMPELSGRLRALREENPEQADRLIERIAPRLREIRDVRSRDPELARLKIIELQAMHSLSQNAMALGESLRSREPSTQRVERLRNALRDSISRSFDAHLSIQRHEVDRLRSRLAELEAEIARREDQRDNLIAQQFEQINARASFGADAPPPARRPRQDGPPGPPRRGG